MSIRTAEVPLNPDNPAQTMIGRFEYAGGIEITSTGSPGLHELSDMEIQPDGRLMAVSDEGYLFDARLILDGDGTALRACRCPRHARSSTSRADPCSVRSTPTQRD